MANERYIYTHTHIHVCALYAAPWNLRSSAYHYGCFRRLNTLRHTITIFGSTRWRSWLRHCATSPQVAVTIPDVVIGILHWHIPSGRTMARRLTWLLTEMRPRNISWGQRRPVRKTDNLTTFMFRLFWSLGASTSWKPQGLSRPVMGLHFITIFSKFRLNCVWIFLLVIKRLSLSEDAKYFKLRCSEMAGWMINLKCNKCGENRANVTLRIVTLCSV